MIESCEGFEPVRAVAEDHELDYDGQSFHCNER